MSRGLFITGTDTGVGKTWLTVALLRVLRARGLNAAGFKPVECGGNGDARAIREACGGEGAGPTMDEINPYALPGAMAPAAMVPPPSIDFDRIRGAHDSLASRHDPVLVEGAGGWLVPLDQGRTVADLAAALGLPVLVVAPNRLGVLNHTLLTVRAIAAAGLECRAIFLNELPGPAGDGDESRAGNARVLRERLPGIPVIEGGAEKVADALFPAT